MTKLSGLTEKENMEELFKKAKKAKNYEEFRDMYRCSDIFTSNTSLSTHFPMIYKSWLDLSACRFPSLEFIYFIYHNNLENKSQEEIMTLWKLTYAYTNNPT